VIDNDRNVSGSSAGCNGETGEGKWTGGVVTGLQETTETFLASRRLKCAFMACGSPAGVRKFSVVLENLLGLKLVNWGMG